MSLSDHSESSIIVWGVFIRFFHWSLVAAFTIAYLTEGDWLLPHVWAGYFIALLIAMRLVWGIIGVRHARFTNFVKPPPVVKAYLIDLVHGRAERYIGHNPAGGAMVIALLSALLMITISGMALYGSEGHGPLNGTWLAAISEDLLEEVHEFFVNFTLILIGLHILGVAHASLIHRENLVRAMWRGRKRS